MGGGGWLGGWGKARGRDFEVLVKMVVIFCGM